MANIDDSDTRQGLLFVYGECGPDVSETEYTGALIHLSRLSKGPSLSLHSPLDWYDNEHAPARLTVPGFLTATRYRAADDQNPSWLAIYDLSTASIAQTDAYKSLRASASINEHSIISRIFVLNRRVYTLLFDKTHPNINATSLPGKFLYIVAMQPIADKPEAEAEFNRWYEEEHIPLLSKTPGWLRSRRYKLVDHAELSGKGGDRALKPPMTYLAVHDWDRGDFREAPEFKTATSTPWVEEIVKNVVDRERRLFTIHKAFKKAQ